MQGWEREAAQDLQVTGRFEYSRQSKQEAEGRSVRQRGMRKRKAEVERDETRAKNKREWERGVGSERS